MLEHELSERLSIKQVMKQPIISLAIMGLKYPNLQEKKVIKNKYLKLELKSHAEADTKVYLCQNIKTHQFVIINIINIKLKNKIRAC